MRWTRGSGIRLAMTMHGTPALDYTPSALILARSDAFSRDDFGFIYDSCHSQSNFRRQFTERDDYLQFGTTSLSQDYRIVSCEILAERVAEYEAQVVFLMQMEVHGRPQTYAELAWLRRENLAWRYHRGQKITAEELPGNPRELSFADFARLDPSTIF